MVSGRTNRATASAEARGLDGYWCGRPPRSADKIPSATVFAALAPHRFKDFWRD
jgi:hypothetical protein